jgi:hypothetical protein
MPKAAARQFLVKVQGIDGYFSRKTGGNISSSSTRVYDGGSTRADIMTGPAEAGDITVGRGWDPERDSDTIATLRQMVGTWTTTLSVTPTDRDLVVVGEPTVYPDAVLVGLNEPEHDAGSGDAAMMELVFAVGDFR